MVHANTHIAFGITITALLSLVIPLTWLDFLLAVCGSFAQDFDFLLSKYAKDENHRLLLTHSLWPGVAAIFLAFPLAMPWIFVAGINSICHVFFDSLDWGVTLFGQKVLFGPRILHRGNSLTINETKERYPNFRCYFTIQWYRNRLMWALEGLSIGGMVTSLVLLNDPFKLFALVLYGLFACVHYGSLIQCVHRYKNLLVFN